MAVQANHEDHAVHAIHAPVYDRDNSTIITCAVLFFKLKLEQLPRAHCSTGTASWSKLDRRKWHHTDLHRSICKAVICSTLEHFVVTVMSFADALVAHADVMMQLRAILCVLLMRW